MPDLVRSARCTPGYYGLVPVICAMTMMGCASWFGREPAQENKFAAYYNQLASDVAKLDPKIQSQVPPPSIGDGRDLTPPKLENRWSLSLAEAIRMALQNNAIVRQNAQFMSPNNPLMRSPDTNPSVYDSLIQNSGVLFGSRGVQAALSDFDPRFTVVMKSGDDITVDNTSIQGQIPPGNLLNNNYTQVQTKIEQQLLGGGIVSINQNWNYSLSNQPLLLYNSNYTGVFGAEYRQPLWAGSGRTYTSIAGPATQRARGFSNVSQGIVIAHINKRLSEIDLQENLQNLVREVGDLYWDLHQNYQDYETEQATAQVAQKLWETIRSRRQMESGVDVAQAEDAYYEARAREELALSNLYITEGQLRRLLSIPLEDVRLIYPSDVPREEELNLNRSMCLYEALVNRIELTRQKTNLHSLQLQLCAARKLVAPKLDFVSGYALNGFGNNLISANSEPFSSAAGNLYSGRETSWNAGFEYSIPLWLRQEKAQVHQLEFRILKAKAGLASQEDEIAHELNTTLMRIKRSHSISKIALHRLQAANRRVEAARAITSEGVKNSDIFLRALTSYTQAKGAYSRSITEYNKYLRDLLFRMGRLLPADGISVLGNDGLPLMSPANPEAPFDDLLKPTEPTPPSPKPLDTDEREEKPFTKPKKTSPVAEGESNSISALSYQVEEDPAAMSSEKDLKSSNDEFVKPRELIDLLEETSSNEELAPPISDEIPAHDQDKR